MTRNNRYVILLSGTVATMQWTYEFHQPSDSMAKDYAKRVLEHDPCAAQAMTATLFNLDTDNRIAGWRIEHKTIVTEFGG